MHTTRWAQLTDEFFDLVAMIPDRRAERLGEIGATDATLLTGQPNLGPQFQRAWASARTYNYQPVRSGTADPEQGARIPTSTKPGHQHEHGLSQGGKLRGRQSEV